jgi:hypothetical protein
MAISTALLLGLLAMGPGHPLGDMSSYLDAMEAAHELENAEAQVVEALSRHAQSLGGAKRIARGAGPGGVPKVTQVHIDGDKATAVVSTSDRTEFMQLIRSNHKWLIVPPERGRIDF